MRVFRSETVIGEGEIGIRKVEVTSGFPLHTHDYIELEYILGGEGIHTVDGKEHRVRRGDMIFLNYGATHSFSTEQGFSHIEIYFSPTLLETGGSTMKSALALLALSSFDGMRREQNGGIVSFSGQERREVEFILEAMLRENAHHAQGFESVMSGYLNVLLIKMLRSSDTEELSDDIWQSLKAYIDSNPEEHITLTGLAAKCFYNPSYFSRVFKQKFGVSLTEYVRSRRIERSKELLKTTDLPIEKVMSEVGFTDKSAFYQAFKKRCGKTPAEYRSEFKSKK